MYDSFKLGFKEYAIREAQSNLRKDTDDWIDLQVDFQSSETLKLGEAPSDL